MSSVPEPNLFDLVLAGNSIAYAAALCKIPYQDAFNQVREIIERRRKQIELLPEIELARLEEAQVKIWEKVKEGDTDAVREFRGLSAERRKLVGADARVEDVHVHEVHVSFAFPEKDRLRLAQPLLGPASHGLRPAPDPVDRDGDEDGEDGGGVDLDSGRDGAG